MYNNRKAQVGETVTWIVATIVIIAVLALSIFLSSLYSDKFKKIQESDSQKVDVLASKSLFSYILTKDSGDEIIYSKLKAEGQLNDSNGNLALQIFKPFYEREGEYSAVWLGILEPAAGNEYFGLKPSVRENVAPDESFTSPHISQTIKLNEEAIEILLIK